MRNDIAMKMISADVIDPRSGRPTQATIAFSVNYSSHSPELALKVANDLTSCTSTKTSPRARRWPSRHPLFRGRSLRVNSRTSPSWTRSSRISSKKSGCSAGPVVLNTQVSERTEMDLRDAENRIAAIDSQRVLLEAQLAQINPTMQVFSDTGLRVMSAEDRLKALKSQLASYKARYAPGHPDIVNAEREVAGLEKEVKATMAPAIARQLDEAKGATSSGAGEILPDHPDVVRLTREVDSLEKTLADAPAWVAWPKTGNGLTPTTRRICRSRANSIR
jgi:succinoglycan biosynthesis transport protein ExoP